jgi:hypothetical protein
LRPSGEDGASGESSAPASPLSSGAGAEDNVFVRDHGVDEIRLKAWDATKFAESVVAIAVRDVVQSNEQALSARRSVMLANSTIAVHERR